MVVKSEFIFLYFHWFINFKFFALFSIILVILLHLYSIILVITLHLIYVSTSFLNSQITFTYHLLYRSLPIFIIFFPNTWSTLQVLFFKKSNQCFVSPQGETMIFYNILLCVTPGRDNDTLKYTTSDPKYKT